MYERYPNETNGMEPGEKHPDLHGTVDWTDKRLARVTRLRLLTDPGFPMWDVSYCHGRLKDGTDVRVQLPFHQLPRRGMINAIVEYAKADGVYARGLGILDGDVISKLW